MLAHHVTKLSADAYLNPTIHIQSSQDSNPTPPVQPPSHARRWTQRQGNGNLCLLGINCICILCRLVSIIIICSPWNRLRKWAEKGTWSPKRLEDNLQENQGGQLEDES